MKIIQEILPDGKIIEQRPLLLLKTLLLAIKRNFKNKIVKQPEQKITFIGIILIEVIL